MQRIIVLCSLLFAGCILPVSVRPTTTEQVWICHANPSLEALEACQNEGTCTGAGTYAIHQRMPQAIYYALSACMAEYSTNLCNINYCQRRY